MNKVFGYSHVSSKEQNLEHKLLLLKNIDSEKDIITDKKVARL